MSDAKATCASETQRSKPGTKVLVLLTTCVWPERKTPDSSILSRKSLPLALEVWTKTEKVARSRSSHPPLNSVTKPKPSPRIPMALKNGTCHAVCTGSKRVKAGVARLASSLSQPFPLPALSVGDVRSKIRPAAVASRPHTRYPSSGVELSPIWSSSSPEQNSLTRLPALVLSASVTRSGQAALKSSDASSDTMRKDSPGSSVRTSSCCSAKNRNKKGPAFSSNTTKQSSRVKVSWPPLKMVRKSPPSRASLSPQALKYAEAASPPLHCDCAAPPSKPLQKSTKIRTRARPKRPQERIAVSANGAACLAAPAPTSCGTRSPNPAAPLAYHGHRGRVLPGMSDAVGWTVQGRAQSRRKREISAASAVWRSAHAIGGIAARAIPDESRLRAALTGEREHGNQRRVRLRSIATWRQGKSVAPGMTWRSRRAAAVSLAVLFVPIAPTKKLGRTAVGWQQGKPKSTDLGSIVCRGWVRSGTRSPFRTLEIPGNSWLVHPLGWKVGRKRSLPEKKRLETAGTKKVTGGIYGDTADGGLARKLQRAREGGGGWGATRCQLQSAPCGPVFEGSSLCFRGKSDRFCGKRAIPPDTPPKNSSTRGRVSRIVAA
eukprot:scaffold1596_cov302-Pinguiococcus_pyrenoidosus.AAC.22